MTADTVPWHKSACILCENNCGIQIQTDGRRCTKIRGDKEHVATVGYTCDKALRLDHYQNGGVRLTTPLRREADGGFTPIDWDTAIREIVARLKSGRGFRRRPPHRRTHHRRLPERRGLPLPGREPFLGAERR